MFGTKINQRNLSKLKIIADSLEETIKLFSCECHTYESCKCDCHEIRDLLEKYQIKIAKVSYVVDLL